MSDATPSVPPPPSAATPTSRSAVGGSIAAVLLALLLLDAAAETLIAGSPILWTVMGVETCALVVLALVWKRAGATVRLAIPLIGLLAVIAWSSVRLGSAAEGALRLATIGLPRLAVGVLVLGTVAAVGLLFAPALLRRTWFVGGVAALVAASSLVPLVRGVVAGTPLVRLLGGALDWPVLPTWLQGGFLATEVVLPLGALAGVWALAASVVARRRATWTVAAMLAVIAAFVVSSVELSRAGRTHLASGVVARLVAAPPLPGTATLPSAVGASGGATVNAPAAPGAAADPGLAQAATGPAGTAKAPERPTPVPAGVVAQGQAGQPVLNKAVEIRVTGHRTTASIGTRAAAPGLEFVIVEMAWKNMLPKQKVNRKKATDRTAGMGSLGFGGGATATDKADDEANTTLESVAFEVSPISKHLWLIADNGVAAVDVEATRGVTPHLGPDAIGIREFEQVMSGGVAFQAPAGAQALSVLFLDAVNGHVLLPVKGAPPALASDLGGGSRANEFVDLVVTGAAFADAPASAAGLRPYVLRLRGISRQPALVDVPFGGYGFLQTDQGCLVEPNAKASGLTRPLAPTGRFLPFVPSDGQLAFEVPAGANPVAFILRLQRGGAIDLPLAGGGRATWPPAEATVTDGDVLRVLKLPGSAAPPDLAAAPSGSERVALDLVVENLRAGSGIDLQPTEQFRLVTPDGKRYAPSADSAKAACRIGVPPVVPAGVARRFTLVYDVPPGQPLQMEYRGFKVKSELIKVR